jgi:L-methionine (R)-S-oxide reductase
MVKEQAYKWANKRIRAQVQRHVDVVATLANTTAILKEYFAFFWVGFYFYRNDHLVLGPFQGPPACVKLTLDKGVCAEAIKQGKTILVANVHDFPGHVACDERSNSEIVVPNFDNNGQIRAVLDIDSIQLDAFDDTDLKYLEQISRQLTAIWN